MNIIISDNKMTYNNEIIEYDNNIKEVNIIINGDITELTISNITSVKINGNIERIYTNKAKDGEES